MLASHQWELVKYVFCTGCGRVFLQKMRSVHDVLSGWTIFVHILFPKMSKMMVCATCSTCASTAAAPSPAPASSWSWRIGSGSGSGRSGLPPGPPAAKIKDQIWYKLDKTQKNKTLRKKLIKITRKCKKMQNKYKT